MEGLDKITLEIFQAFRDLISLHQNLWRGQMELVRTLYKDESGASSVEYCILLACIAIAILSAVGIFGSAVKGLYTKNNAELPF
jgi:Flp pilus assembly pilin Flp